MSLIERSRFGIETKSNNLNDEKTGSTESIIMNRLLKRQNKEDIEIKEKYNKEMKELNIRQLDEVEEIKKYIIGIEKLMNRNKII